MVVTDHHSPRADGALPDAPIVHPAVCGYPCVDLCATAVAYKLAQALWAQAGVGQAEHGAARVEVETGEAERGGYRVEDDLDLVALATIADVVALTGENRTLVRRGLRALARPPSQGCAR